jgi:hypothetical protein
MKWIQRSFIGKTLLFVIPRFGGDAWIDSSECRYWSREAIEACPRTTKNPM